jgi:hypothetical protein
MTTTTVKRILPGFATLSEFFSFHGDCGELATLAALHTIDPQRWPLSGAALDALTKDELLHGEADPKLSGGQNIPSICRFLERVGIAYTVVGYSAFTLDKLHAALKQWAGLKPLIVEWSKAGALPGDEKGVQYHYSCCGGIDTSALGGVGGYLWADGDNRSSGKSPGAPVIYTWEQIQAAAPIAYIVLTEPTKSAAPTPPVPAPKPAPAASAPSAPTATTAALALQVAQLQAQVNTLSGELADVTAQREQLQAQLATAQAREQAPATLAEWMSGLVAAIVTQYEQAKAKEKNG